ncbi:unnamed protein product [Dibothriocephalus latus]|uniref:Uncharacterized protein n=1 Tax=Dibothriocephalus latus TaxID=60516 RepID=A0A3P6PKV3_DIBLA|nr:unnamed protein product [Dibothriocephalus latus]
MDATQLREILEQPHDESNLDAKPAGSYRRPNFQVGADVSGCDATGTTSKPSGHLYTARWRSQSSSCEKNSRKMEPPVVPPHDAGMS